MRLLFLLFLLTAPAALAQLAAVNDALPRDGKVVVRRVLRNYISDSSYYRPCMYVYGLMDSCPAYFNREKIKRLFPFLTNVDSFIQSMAPNLALSSLATENIHLLRYGFLKDERDEYYFSKIYAHDRRDMFLTADSVLSFGVSKLKKYFGDSSDWGNWILNPRYTWYYEPSFKDWTPFAGDSVEKYGRDTLESSPTFELAEEITLKKGRVTDRKLLTFSWGFDRKDDGYTVWLGSADGAEIERLFRRIEADSVNLDYNFRSEVSHKAYRPLRWLKAEYPYGSSCLGSLMRNPAAFSEYTYVDGKPFRSREDAFRWLMRADNPLRPTAPPKEKGNLVARWRLVNAIYHSLNSPPFHDLPDTATIRNRRMYQGEEAIRQDSMIRYKRNYGYVRRLIADMTARINDPNEIILRYDSLDQSLTRDHLWGTIMLQMDMYSAGVVVPIDSISPEYFMDWHNFYFYYGEEYDDFYRVDAVDLLVVYDIENGRISVSDDYPGFIFLYTHTPTLTEPIAALKLKSYILKGKPGLHLVYDTPRMLLYLNGHVPSTLEQGFAVPRALDKRIAR